MIIIGGVPRAGKTNLGKKFAKNGWQHFEFDLFKYFLKSIIDSPSVNNLWQYNSKSVWDKYNSPEDIFEHYLKTANLMEKGLLNVIEKIDFSSNSIIESTYLLPKLLSEIREKHPEVKVLCTGFKNIQNIEESIIEGLKNNPDDWIRDIGENNLRKVISTFGLMSKWIKSECSKYNIRYIDYEAPRNIWVDNIYKELS